MGLGRYMLAGRVSRQKQGEGLAQQKLEELVPRRGLALLQHAPPMPQVRTTRAEECGMEVDFA